MSDFDGESAIAPRRALGSRYELVSPIGQGATGEVWRAWDRDQERYLAAKLLRPELIQDPDTFTRFLQERSILIGLNHPNIVRIHDLVVEGNDLAIIMDLVTGGSLGDHRRTVGTLAPAVAVPLIATVLEALAHAHQQGVLHRDIKPDNILLAEPGPPRPELVRLSDFGIARLTQEGTVQATSLIGTPLYMPPELFMYGQISPKSDVYAAGIVLYELLAGRTPFAGPGTVITIGQRHVRSAAPPLPLPPALWQLALSLLSKDPARRPAAAEAAAHLRDLAQAGLDLNPLPAQPAPEDWDETDSVLPGKSTLNRQAGPTGTTTANAAVVQSGGSDPNATALRNPGLIRPAIAPAADSETAETDSTPVDPHQTQFKQDVHHVITAPLPEPAATPKKPERSC